jgi:hypothetical protein
MSYDPDPSWLEEKKLDPHNEVYLANYIGEITKYSLEREIIYSTNENNYTTNSANGTIVECTISMVPYCTFGNHDHSNGIDTTCRGLAYTAVETCTTYFLGGSSDGESSNAGGSTNNPDPCPSGGTTGTVIVGNQPISGIGGGFFATGRPTLCFAYEII